MHDHRAEPEHARAHAGWCTDLVRRFAVLRGGVAEAERVLHLLLQPRLVVAGLGRGVGVPLLELGQGLRETRGFCFH